MKNVFLFIFLAFISIATTYKYQIEDTSANLELEWTTDYAAAVKKAKKENKALLLNFTGSDWCGWCVRLHREVFSKEEFIKYANENLVCVKLDFPKRKQLPAEEQKQNISLLRKYGVRGFPSIYILNAEEETLLKTGYRSGGATVYVNHLDAAIKRK